ncbi:hypothetical protein FPSE5266_20349 [Fusarium pseudograminearum]|nr:hypothetical protein FPSE5266_20349 [Fusarium pseudograminearum]
MPAPNFSQLSDPLYNNQQTHPSAEFSPDAKQEAVKKEEEGSAQFSWDEYVRAARPAADQAPVSQLLTRDVEASDGQLQLNQNRPSSSDTVKNEHEETDQSSSQAAPEIKQDDGSGLDLAAIDPRLFASNYDKQSSAKRPSF